MQEFITIGIYCILGTALMMFGTFVVDLVAVGSVMAGISTGIGIIIRAAVASPSGEAVQESLGSGILSTLYYYGLGLLFCVVGYVALTLFNRRYDLNKEIGNGNPAAGIMVAGMFVGLSIIISGVIL